MDYIDLTFFQRIHPKSTFKGNRCSIQCDICGDSKHNKNLQRLEIYDKGQGTFVKCFNCGWTGSMQSYIKNYHYDYYQDYLLEKGYKSLDKIKQGDFAKVKENDGFLGMKIEVKEKPKIIEEAIPPYAGLVPVFGATKQYIENRGIDPTGFYTPHHKFVSTPDGRSLDYKDFVIYPLPNWNGFYARHIYEKKFKTYVYKGNKYIEVVKDATSPIYVFEGIFDALSAGADNYIVMMGADLSKELLDKYKDRLIFCYDNDKTGIEKSMKLVQTNKVLFLKDFKEKDLNEIMLKYKYTKQQMLDLINANLVTGMLGLIKLKTRRV